jgi:hypothetical protein
MKGWQSKPIEPFDDDEWDVEEEQADFDADELGLDPEEDLEEESDLERDRRCCSSTR